MTHYAHIDLLLSVTFSQRLIQYELGNDWIINTYSYNKTN